MKRKVWKRERQYCTRCMRYVKPRWDERRQLWFCPLCFRVVYREPAPPAGEQKEGA